VHCQPLLISKTGMERGKRDLQVRHMTPYSSVVGEPKKAKKSLASLKTPKKP
jgi:hypothetical protein